MNWKADQVMLATTVCTIATTVNCEDETGNVKTGIGKTRKAETGKGETGN